jgi:glycosyltransferase involved in cell wall biosynthesis
LFVRTQVKRVGLSADAVRGWLDKKTGKRPAPENASSPDLAQIAQRLQDLEASTTLLLRSIKTLTVPSGVLELPPSASEPLVSVVLPTWNRGDIIETAVASVRRQTYPHWQLIIVDDGSTDDTAERMTPLLADSRILYFPREHKGVGAARNFGLAEAQGDIVAYLDSDNVWFPKYLEMVVAAYMRDQELQSVYTAQIIDNERDNIAMLRGREFDYEQLRDGNYIDLNAYSHRYGVYGRLGGFDEQLDRLVDWDLITRYTEHDKTRFLPVIGGSYHIGRADQISSTSSREYNHYLIRAKRRAGANGAAPLKVLYALWHYPQLSESYVRTEIDAVRKMGVDVEICAEEAGAAPFESETPIHYDGVRAAIDRFRPDVVHTHWLSYGDSYGNQLGQSGLPLTVRGHGFEFSPALAAKLDKLDRVASIYVFPHFADACRASKGKVKSVPAAFNPDYYFPQREKDRRLVVRTACALKTKEIDVFMRIAQMCAGFRFVLVLARGHKVEWILDEIVEQNRQMGSPVEIRVNMQHAEVGALMRTAGIYLHTIGTSQPYGMPISIAEAMACGCYIIGRRRPGSAEYIGDAGTLYDTAEEAAELVQATECWSDRRWIDAFLCSADRAYRHYVSDLVIGPIVDDWRRIAGKTV